MDAHRPAAPESTIPSDDLVEDSFVRYEAALLRYVTARTRDADLAADIAHEAFLRLLQETQAGRAPRAPLPWLQRVALNLVISGARRTAVAERSEPRLRSGAVSYETPEVAALVTERDAILHEALTALEPTQRQAIVLAARGFGGGEIAALIGRSEGATRTLMCRARSKLRADLREAMA
jgi:RNA polymerase sigma-70 factor (ECF subfamily)